MSEQRLVAGVDLGGTNLRCAVAGAGEPARVLARRSAVTPPRLAPAAMIELISSQVDLCLSEAGASREAVGSVGCAVAGITDSARGVLISAANLHGWHEVPLARLLEERFRVAAAVENDVRSAALAEYKFGAGRGRRSLVFMTVSTGVAAGIILEGRVLRGAHNFAGEIAYMLPEPAHIGKDWGLNGCLELTAAGVGIAREWSARSSARDAASAADVFRLAREGDAEAARVVARARDYLSQAAVSICTLIDPEVLVVGGGIAENEPGVVGRIGEVIEETLPYPPVVTLTELGGVAPLTGALALAAEKAAAA